LHDPRFKLRSGAVLLLLSVVEQTFVNIGLISQAAIHLTTQLQSSAAPSLCPESGMAAFGENRRYL
jgi:hypothetical protein